MIKYNVNGEMSASFGLCEGRHDYPVTECIFPEVISTFAFQKLELDAKDVLLPLVQQGLKKLVIYTSGCLSALIAVINVAQQLHIREITVMHYDNYKGDYQAQKIITLNDIYL